MGSPISRSPAQVLGVCGGKAGQEGMEASVSGGLRVGRSLSLIAPPLPPLRLQIPGRFQPLEGGAGSSGPRCVGGKPGPCHLCCFLLWLWWLPSSPPRDVSPRAPIPSSSSLLSSPDAWWWPCTLPPLGPALPPTQEARQAPCLPVCVVTEPDGWWDHAAQGRVVALNAAALGHHASLNFLVACMGRHVCLPLSVSQGSHH